MSVSKLERQIYALLAEQGAAPYLRFEDRLDWTSPRALRRQLGELIVLGQVEQVRSEMFGLLYVLTPAGEQRAAQQRLEAA